ncbi:mitochondrial protein Pet127-domain-containing protein [Hygrophoropsis aurantiaca]|uniref:Mitochondrial protein Pet127-domain-containing protein n=1 Tax=Hygrophoropsis aurantiaca TaxID=72124 RepID=A0ACB8AR95_9AGAM|nr:mitochondrial protein Pet127-domain-containing protein [Hygrophoropsis aurantiaca]
MLPSLRLGCWGYLTKFSVEGLARKRQPHPVVSPMSNGETIGVRMPPETSSEKQRRPPPHKQHHPLAYTRRIEGLLPDEQEKVLADIESPSEQKPIATLAHGLDRVLFNPGVHWLQDPRSRVYNFTPWVENIPEVTDFAFERVTGFVKSSMDEDLWALAKKEGRTFAGSTSSLTGMLSHVYFLVSDDRDVDTSLLSRHFQREPTTFTWGQRMPVSVVLNYRDGVYTIDSEKSASDDPDKNVLTWMGTMLEKFLTVPESEFKQYLRSSHVEIEDDGDARREAYRYSKSNSFVMRSQLDCVDKRLPGTGVFDIKTRAAVSIRLDMFNYEENSGYLIRSLHGPIESFEKEYYDLIRSAFLKYSFQARIGNMDGVLVAYHNTARLFGFQYVSLDEMDARLFGGAGRGERVFTKCVRMLERVMEEVITVFPANSVKCTFDTKEGSGMMRVWVEPTEWDEEGTKPIAQLDVETESFLDHSTVRGSRAIAAVESPWLLHWKISRSSLDYADIRENLAATQQRQSRAWALPEDLGVDAMEKKWNEMDFGGKRREEEMKVSKDEDSNPLDSASIADDEGQQIPTKSTFDPMKFKAPSAAVRNLRRLAREGRVETEQNEAEMGEKVLWASTSHIEGVLESQPAESVATHDESSPSGEVEVDYRFESDHNKASAISSLPAEPVEMDCVEITADGDPVPSGSDGIVVEAGLSTTLQPNGGSHASQSGMDR